MGPRVFTFLGVYFVAVVAISTLLTMPLVCNHGSPVELSVCVVSFFNHKMVVSLYGLLLEFCFLVEFGGARAPFLHSGDLITIGTQGVVSGNPLC